MNENPPTNSSPSILIIEDDVILSKMYSEKFKIEGFITSVAGDGEQALKLLAEKMPDFILLDVNLPTYSGLELLTRIRNDELGKNIPVIALTNVAEKKSAEQFLQLGAKEYLVKAMHSPEEVVEKVKSYLT